MSLLFALSLGCFLFPCSEYEGLATAEEIASTPREDDQLEGLAIQLDGSLVASQETYDRLVADQAAWRSAYPEIAHIESDLWGYGRFVEVRDLPEDQQEALFYGEHEDTVCADAFYGRILEEGTDWEGSVTDTVTLEFKGTYDEDALAAHYGELLQAATSPLTGRDWDGDYLCVIQDGETWEYLLEDGWGDCPAGCTGHHWWYLRSSAAGEVELLADWGDDVDAGDEPDPDPDPRPDWMDLGWTCFPSVGWGG